MNRTLTIVAIALGGVATPALAVPDHACHQVGVVKAIPPLIPQAMRIDECSSFAGGPDAVAVGRLWCDHAARSTLMPHDVPPKVTTVAVCPKGAIALCTAQVPNSTVTVSRYFYVADPGAGGLDGLRKMCEGRKRKDPTAVFTPL
jgi:hypothetical protein